MGKIRTGASANAVATPSTTSMALPEEERRACGKMPIAFFVLAGRPVWPACARSFLNYQPACQSRCGTPRHARARRPVYVARYAGIDEGSCPGLADLEELEAVAAG